MTWALAPGSPLAGIPGLTRAAYLLSIGLAVGCAYVPTTQLDYDPAGPKSQSPAPLTLAVVPFDEARLPLNMSSEMAHLFLTYIPGLPYVEIPYERLDEYRLLVLASQRKAAPQDEAFPIALSRAVARDLRGSGLFREVRDIASAADAGDADLVLGGSLRSTELDVYATSYMLGMPGVALWVLPIPCASTAATIQIDLSLRTPKGQEVWSFPVKARASHMFTLYNEWGAEVVSPSPRAKRRYPDSLPTDDPSIHGDLEIKRYGSNDLGIDGDSLWAYHAEALRAGMEPAKASLRDWLSQSHDLNP